MLRTPSIFKILITDYAAFMGIIAAPILWGLYLITLLDNDFESPEWKLVAIFGAISAAALGVVFWRVRLIHTIFADGLEVQATIRSIDFDKDRGRIEYTYTHNGEQCRSANALMKFRQTEVLRVGDQVPVMVDRSHPNRAFLRDLYLSKPVETFTPNPNWDDSGIRIVFQGQYEKDTFYRAVFLIHKPSTRETIWRVVLLAALVIIIFAFLLYGGQDVHWEKINYFRLIVRPVIVGLIGLAAIVKPVIGAYFTAHKLWNNPAQQAVQAGEIDPQGVRYTTGCGEKQFVPWSKFVKIRLEYNLVVLQTSEGAIHAFPRSFFQSGEDWASAVNLILFLVRPAVP